MKTFKELREAKEKENPEAKALKPRAKGEEDFMNQHTVIDVPHPTAGKDHDYNDSVKQTKHTNTVGDRAVIKQGTSVLQDKSGFKNKKTPLTRADKEQGDMKPVRGPSSVTGFVKESVDFDEGVYTLQMENGDLVEITEEQMEIFENFYNDLSDENKAIFVKEFNDSIESFDELFNLVMED